MGVSSRNGEQTPPSTSNARTPNAPKKPQLSMAERRLQRANQSSPTPKTLPTRPQKTPPKGPTTQQISKMARDNGDHLKKLYAADGYQAKWKEAQKVNTVAVFLNQLTGDEIMAVTINKARTPNGLKPLLYFQNAYELDKNNASVLRSLLEGMGPIPIPKPKEEPIDDIDDVDDDVVVGSDPESEVDVLDIDDDDED